MSETVERLKSLLEQATKTHEVHLNDPDYGEGGRPDDDYCHLCWERTKAREEFFKVAVNALPGLLKVAEAAIAWQRERHGLRHWMKDDEVRLNDAAHELDLALTK